MYAVAYKESLGGRIDVGYDKDSLNGVRDNLVAYITYAADALPEDVLKDLGVKIAEEIGSPVDFDTAKSGITTWKRGESKSQQRRRESQSADAPAEDDSESALSL